jgi:hypothetical protein
MPVSIFGASSRYVVERSSVVDRSQRVPWRSRDANHAEEWWSFDHSVSSWSSDDAAEWSRDHHSAASWSSDHSSASSEDQWWGGEGKRMWAIHVTLAHTAQNGAHEAALKATHLANV